MSPHCFWYGQGFVYKLVSCKGGESQQQQQQASSTPHYKNLITYAENVTSYLQATVLRALATDCPRASYGDGKSAVREYLCVAKLIISYRLAR